MRSAHAQSFKDLTRLQMITTHVNVAKYDIMLVRILFLAVHELNE